MAALTQILSNMPYIEGWADQLGCCNIILPWNWAGECEQGSVTSLSAELRL